MKNTIKSISLPIIYSIVSTIVLLLVSNIYTSLNVYYYGYTTEEQLLEYFDSKLYIDGLGNFLNSNLVYIGLIIFCLFIPYLLKKYYKNNTKINKISFKDILYIIILGMLFSGISNLIFYLINETIEFTNAYNISTYNYFPLIISNGILGPILEEYMFRGVIYNNLQKENDKMLSIIMTSILFSMMHTGIDSILYSFALSFLLIYVYEKYKTIKAPIILHMTLN